MLYITVGYKVPTEIIWNFYSYTDTCVVLQECQSNYWGKKQETISMEGTQGLYRHGVSLLPNNQKNRVTRTYETSQGSAHLPHLAQRKKTCHCWWLFSAVFLVVDWHVEIRVNKLETLLTAAGFSMHNALAQQMTFYCFQKLIRFVIQKIYITKYKKRQAKANVMRKKSEIFIIF